MAAMTAARDQIARELEGFEGTLRRVRHEAITAEIIEFGGGAAAAHDPTGEPGGSGVRAPHPRAADRG